jgi:hypothetical protein
MRRVATLVLEPKPVQEVEVPADSTMLGLQTSGTSIVLIIGVPGGSGPVRRKTWVTFGGQDLTVEAQNGECLGHVILPTAADGQPAIAIVHIETQKYALERATHRGGRSSAL